LKVPDPEEFSKLVETYEKKHGEYDRTYRDAFKKFEAVRLRDLSEDDIEYILIPYFLKWGKMGRVLGRRGARRMGYRLKEMDAQLSKFRQEDLSTIDLSKMGSEIANVYCDMRVGPTTAAKALHLVAPNLFMLWDTKIRNFYGFKGNGEDYLRFLTNMQNWMKKLKPTIERLQTQYKKSCTKIIDEYNWTKSSHDC